MANATTTAKKASRMRADEATGSVVSEIWAARNTKAHAMFDGKTLKEVAKEFNLWDDDVMFGFNKNPKTGEEIKNLVVKVKDVEYVIPFSRGADADNLDNLDDCNNWMFRVSSMRKKGADGKPLGNDAEGNVIVDETMKYLSFGKNGLSLERKEAAFTPIEAEEAG